MGGSRRSRSVWVRRVAVFTAFGLALSVGAPAGALPRQGGFPLGWLWSWLKQTPGWSAPAVPVQPTGGAVGGGGQVGTEATRADGGSGRAPTPAPGALPPEVRQAPPVRQGTTAAIPGDQSFDPARSTRIAAAASATSDVYANPDGSFTRRVYQSPVNYRASDGSFKPVDGTLVRGGDGRWRAKANSLDVSFGPDAAAAGLAIMRADAARQASFTLVGATAAAASAAGDTALYPSALPSTDVRLRMGPAGFATQLVLRSASAPSSWLFRLDTAGLSAAVHGDGSLLFRDDTGAVRAATRPGFMNDAAVDARSGGTARSLAVRYELTTVDGKPALRVAADAAWLRDAARRFPVTVTLSTTDPTVAAGGDTYVTNTEAGDRSGEPELLAGSFDAGGHKARSFLRFDAPTAVYGSARLSGVSLRLFNTFAASCNPTSVWVYPVDGATTSSTTGWAGPQRGDRVGGVMPTPGPACGNTNADPAVGTWVSVPLDMAAVETRLAGAAVELSVGADEADSAGWKRFASADSASGSGPVLQVTYAANVPPQVVYQYPPFGAVVDTWNPLLVARGHDPDRYPKPDVGYQFSLYDKNGTRLAQSVWLATNHWYAGYAYDRLRWGETYLWTVVISDGALGSTNQTVNAFTLQPRQSSYLGLSDHGGRGYDPGLGNYTTSATDAVLATVGPALSIHRFYNSLDRRDDSVFGIGWSSLLDAKAFRPPDVVFQVRVRYPNGPEVTFGDNRDGSYFAPPGRHASLTGNRDTGYQLVDKDGTTYRFTQPGRGFFEFMLASVSDAAGRTLTIGYEGGKATTVTSASGRRLYVSWSPGALPYQVSSVSTDPVVPGDPSTALTWTYTIEALRLAKVCPPGSATACTSYTYATGSLYPRVVLDSAPHSYWRLGESTGTVAASSVAEHLGTDNAAYSNVTLGQVGPLAGRGTTATAAGFDGASSHVSLPGQLVTSVVNKSIQLWFKANPGQGGVLFSYSADPITNSGTAGGYVPAVYIGSSGKLYATFWPLQQIVTPAVVNDGRWHHLVLTNDGSYPEMFLDGAFVDHSYTDAVVVDFGQRHAYVGAGFIGGGWPDNPYSGQAPQRSFFKGSIAEVALYDRNLDDTQATELHDAGYLGERLLTRVVRPSGNPTATVGYDPLTGRVAQVSDQHGGVWKVSTPAASGSSQVYVASVLSGGPADYWRLAEGAGVTDAVNQVNGNTATYNAVTLGVPGGPFADTTVASFNPASQSHLRLPAADAPGTGPQSISMWFKTTAAGVLFGYEGGGGWVPALYVGTDGKLRGHFWVGNMSLIATTAGSVADGQWHHVALAASTSSQSLYVDGARVGGPVNATLQTIFADRAWVGMGRWDGGWPARGSGQYSFFNGQIAEVAIYRSQLSDTQVAAQHSARGKSAGAPANTVTVTDPAGKTSTHLYDLPGGRRIAETDTLGNTTRYGYDTGGFLRTVTDPNGNQTITEHDVRGNTVSSSTCQDQSANRCSTIYYTYFPDATSRTLTPDPRNDVLLTIRDARSASASDNTYLTTHAYDTKGNRTAVTDPWGHTTTSSYTDGTTVAAADGGFAPPGLPHTVTTADGAVQRVTYLKSGDVAKVIDPAGKQTTFTYDGVGRPLAETDTTDTVPAGLTTSYRYDKLGRVVEARPPAATNRVTGAVHTPVTSTVYDVDGLVTSQSVADVTGGDAARTETATYNGYGQQISATDPAGNTTRFDYDAYGNLVLETEPDGGKTRTVYDAEGRLLSTTTVGFTGDPNNPSPARDVVLESRAYDPAGRLASVTDAMGWVTAHTYTDNGLTATVIRKDPSTGAMFVTENNSYDPAGHPVQQITNDGATTTTAVFDKAGRQATSTVDPAGLKRTTSIGYSRDNHPVATVVTDATGAVVAQQDTMYDPLGRPVAQTVYKDANPPIARWRLAETSGTRAADSAGNNTAAASNVTWTAERGGAAVLGGSGVLTAAGPAVDNLRSFTVAAWVYPTDTAANRAVIGQAGRSESGFYLKLDHTGGDRWFFTQQDEDMAGTSASAAVSAAGSATLNTWHHVAGVFDAAANQVKLYVNGTLAGSHTLTYKPFGAVGPVTIGKLKWHGGLVDGFFGKISDVQAYQRALSDADITAVKNGTAPAAGAGVIRTSSRLDQGGLARSVTDPNGNTTDIDYDTVGRATVTTKPAVLTETNGGPPVLSRPVSYVGYDTFGAVTETKDPNGNVTTTGYDAAGRPTVTILPGYTPPGSTTPIVATTRHSYNSLGQLTQSTDPLGHTTGHTYDQLGRLARTTAPDGAVTKHGYDLLGDLLSSTDPSGALDTATYDYLGRKKTASQVVRQDNNAVHTTHHAYAAGGWLSSVQQPTGVTHAMTYNAAGETLTVRDGAGNLTSHSYDGAGRPAKSTNPDGSHTTIGYDLAGRTILTRSHSSGGAVLAERRAGYDNTGNTIAATDPRGATTTFGYDATGLLVTATEPVSTTESITTGFGYDPAGHRTRFTDGRGNPFITTYTSWGLPESVIEPATAAYPGLAERTFTTVYDAAGRPVSVRRPGAVTITNSYDPVGNLIRQVGAGAEAATADRVFGYDPAGRMTSFSAPGGTNAVAWDDRDLLRSATGPSGNTTFGYNPDGQMATRADAAGTTSYSYDPAGRLAGVTNPTRDVSLSIGYNAVSQPTSIRYGTGGGANTRSLGYDGLHRLIADELKTHGGTTIAKIGYGYDGNGNLTAKTTTGFAGAAANTYSYDLANRLTTWTAGAATTYTYDKSGNRTSAGSQTFGYDQRNQLTAADGVTYQYTPRGTLKAAGAVTTQADAYGQIATQQVPGGQGQTYAYDALGRLARDGFAYTGLGNDLAGDGTAAYTRDPDGDLHGEATATSKVLAFTDLHTDVVGQFTATGTTLTGSTAYDPLGKVLATAGMVGSLGYQSEWTDTRTGRVNMWHRWYNTTTGQFDTRDTTDVSPIPASAAGNRFAYADDNPLTGTDPTGQVCLRCAWNRTVSTVSRTVSTAWNYATSWASSAYSYVDDALQVGRRWASERINDARKFVAQKVSQAKKYVAKKYHQAKKYVAKKYHQAKKWVAHKVNHAKKNIRKTITRAKQAGKIVAAAAVRTVKHHVNAVKDGLQAAKDWIKDHKDLLIDIAAIGVGVLAGLACTAVTAGVGAVACMVGAAALVNLAKDAAHGNIHNWGDAFGSLGAGAATGLIGGAFGAAGGKLVGLAASKLGGLAGNIGGRIIGGAATGGIADAGTQLATTGRVNWGGAGMAAGIGGAFGGFYRGGTPRAGGGHVDLYHGASKTGAENIRANGIDLSAGRPDADFGPGFYTTKDKTQAEAWAATRSDGETLHYRVPRTELDRLATLRFEQPGSNWAQFVLGNRTRTAPMHGYDAVEGSMILNHRQVRWEGAAPVAGGHQLSFHTERAATMMNKYLQ